MKTLTKRQKEILEYIEEFQEYEGMAPTITEISNYFGIKTSSTFAHIKALERKKELTRSSKARSIATTSNKTRKNVRLFGGSLIVPLLGRVNAGAPIDVTEAVEQTIVFDKKLLGAKNGDILFALRVQGESMRDLGILDGDIIVVEKDAKVKDNDIVVALVNNEVTVKTFRKNGKMVELHPANKDFDVQIYPAQFVSIQGKVRHLHRQF